MHTVMRTTEDVNLVYLPQWDLEFFKNFTCLKFAICMTYAAFSYLVAAPTNLKVTLDPW